MPNDSSIFADIAGVAGKIVPGIATLIFGPAGGAVANGVIEAARTIFGDEAASSAAALERAIAADPQAALAFKSKLLDIQEAANVRAHAERMAEHQDRASARSMQTATGSRVVPIMTLITVLMFFVTNGAALFGMFWLMVEGVEIRPESASLALAAASTFGTILGWVNAKADIVWSFFFGSSASSSNKTEAMTTAITEAVRGGIKR